MNYEVVIGLEVHCQLLTNSKIFCSCSAAFGGEANTDTCPVCLGMPGTLPVLNKNVVNYAIRTALATNHRINESSRFARKNYFYPDLPKGYQISQYELPIAEHGHLDIELSSGEKKRIGITRIHMEEDAGKSVHDASPDGTLVNFNRTGVPLIEIVSEPDMRSAEEAVEYLKKLRNIVIYLGVCDGNMEEGSFRCDANISIRPVGQKELGTKAELKNMNSFRFVQKAIEYEILRQENVLKGGGEIIQETRLWDANKGVTASMRGKEEAHDYRYFPDPDLLPLVVDEKWIEDERGKLPELPDAKRERFMREHNLPDYDAGVLTADKAYADYFESVVKLYKTPKTVSNWIMGELTRRLNEDEKSIENCLIKAEDLAALLGLIDKGTISGNIAKKVFQDMYASGKKASVIVKEKGLEQVSDTGAIEAIVDKTLEANPDQVEQFKAGKEKVLGFFVGQVMKESKGKANPGMVNQLIRDKLKS
ncbi:MAG: Asp-tRNA(Asn)/Glu-tRNA(Gln) amidotransferase subunit GatB [Proteobacteria bacterium]|nr:Asp-tRNA(Asn)/Glu-tRNA(Gln) amidotransferase subunit GatB [Pseudomonadota bacterium]